MVLIVVVRHRSKLLGSFCFWMPMPQADPYPIQMVVKKCGPQSRDCWSPRENGAWNGHHWSMQGTARGCNVIWIEGECEAKVRDLQSWHRSNLAQRVPRVWRGQVLDRHRDFALRQHELEPQYPQWTIPSDFSWSDRSPMFAVKVSICSTARLAGTAKRTAVHCGRTVSWLQGPMPRGTRWVVS